MEEKFVSDYSDATALLHSRIVVYKRTQPSIRRAHRAQSRRTVVVTVNTVRTQVKVRRVGPLVSFGGRGFRAFVDAIMHTLREECGPLARRATQ